MPLVTSKQMLLDAQRGQYAVGAFNTENMEMTQAIIQAAEELGAPVMIQTTSSTLKYASAASYYHNVCALAQFSKVPVCIHLDHGDSYETAAKCLRAGYTSLMIGGSKSAFEQNIAITRRVVDMAKPCNIPVEAELGTVGGKEDDVSAQTGYTNPEQAREFTAQTRIDSLAVAIGTAHGVYKVTPVLDKELLSKIRAIVDIPLVLHGASGLSDTDVRECVSRGICKVNFATELRIAYSDGVKSVLQQDPKVFDPKAYGKVARENVRKVVIEKILMCGSEGKA